MNDAKIITKETFGRLRESFRRDRQIVVLCHGVYDLLHYGHIEHLREAKRQGDVLVVSVTAASFVNKGPGRPYFNDKQRMAFLASLEIVDYVILSEAATVHEVVKYARPDIYVKGQEYANARNDITGNIQSEQEIVESYGGRIYFTQGEVFSSTKLLNNFFDALPEKVIQLSHDLKEQYGPNLIENVRSMIEGFKGVKTLVVGDIIIDEYVFCKVQGLTSKDGAMSALYDAEERYAGGALAISRHLANFCGDVTFCAIMGKEKHLRSYIEETMTKVKLELFAQDAFQTPVKRRYLKRNPQRQEYDKLFSINYLKESKEFDQVDRGEFHQWLNERIQDFDLVVVCDYGHGLIDGETIEIVEKKARFIALNCQTNSSNYGMNIITKYQRADAFVVDERELRLAYGKMADRLDDLLETLRAHLNAFYGWVTIGANGAIGRFDGKNALIPAVLLHVKDTVGAGDAFYSLAALCAVNKVPLDIATLVCNTAGAIKTNLVGNSKPVEKVDLEKFLNTILNV